MKTYIKRTSLPLSDPLLHPVASLDSPTGQQDSGLSEATDTSLLPAVWDTGSARDLERAAEEPHNSPQAPHAWPLAALRVRLDTSTHSLCT